MNTPKTEREKMLAGELYFSTDRELVDLSHRASRLLLLYNQTTIDQREKRTQLLQALFAKVGKKPFIVPPFYCDYGGNIEVGDNFFLNVNCIILDCNRVTIGDNFLGAPNIQIYTAYHPTDPQVRLSGLELAAPITIGDNVWVGGGAIICPGVTIGDNTTIGAGSVVTKDIPANVVAAGNPCRVIREV